MTSYELIYQLKPGTTASYLLINGEHLLPSRLSITFGQFREIRHYRWPDMRAGQMKGQFKKSEASPYRIGIGSLHTTIGKSRYTSYSGDIVGCGDIRGSDVLLVFKSNDKDLVRMIPLRSG